jgi:hypothetical protein
MNKKQENNFIIILMTLAYRAATKNKKVCFIFIVPYSSEHIHILTFVICMNEGVLAGDLYNRE